MSFTPFWLSAKTTTPNVLFWFNDLIFFSAHKNFKKLIQQHFFLLQVYSFASSGVNFTNILLAQLRQYSCANKKFNLHCKHKKASRETFVQKKESVKCWWNWPLVAKWASGSDHQQKISLRASYLFHIINQRNPSFTLFLSTSFLSFL